MHVAHLAHAPLVVITVIVQPQYKKFYVIVANVYVEF